MTQRPVRSRLHMIAARSAPIIVVVQRKRAKLFHIFTINTRTHHVEEGSWFRGKIFALRSDISFDGRFMVYLALGATGETWNGVCQLPWLKTIVQGGNIGTWHGGGYFAQSNILRINEWSGTTVDADAAPLSFELEAFRAPFDAGDLGILYCRFERDGFRRLGPSWGKGRQVSDRRAFTVEWVGDDGWARQFSPRHPELQLRYLGYSRGRDKFKFSLTGYEGFLDDASWATWDTGGWLWVARPGAIEQYDLIGLKSGRPTFSLDVDQFEPPIQAE